MEACTHALANLLVCSLDAAGAVASAGLLVVSCIVLDIGDGVSEGGLMVQLTIIFISNHFMIVTGIVTVVMFIIAFHRFSKA